MEEKELNPQDKIVCLYGEYKDNHILTEEGDYYFVISYRALNQIIDGRIGFFNLKYDEKDNYWVIFQYCLID